MVSKCCDGFNGELAINFEREREDKCRVSEMARLAGWLAAQIYVRLAGGMASSLTNMDT